MPIQTDDNGTRPALDGLDALFADLHGEPNLEPSEILWSRDIPAIGDGGLLAAFQE